MDLREKHEKLAAGHRAAKYNFILTELDLALTFCQMAMASEDKAKSVRNKDNAQRACDAAMHFLNDDGFSGSMKANVRRKVAELKCNLKKLREQKPRLATARTP